MVMFLSDVGLFWTDQNEVFPVAQCLLPFRLSGSSANGIRLFSLEYMFSFVWDFI